MDQDKRSPFIDYCQVWDSQEKMSSTEYHLFARQDKWTRKCACSGLVLHNINGYPWNIYEQWLNVIIDEVNDC